MTSTVVGVTLTTAAVAPTYISQAIKHTEPQVRQGFQSLLKSGFGGSCYRGGFPLQMSKQEATVD
uniref:Uncharacterized protein n=1 Tax=Peromyscus maniculatus bairdii TaxID=230844 RepID=A0A8C8UPS5_PERMB